ncbi:peptidase [Fulvivirga lutimaris]|nr:zinc-dependent peptidase [Fulvivirga lutimaris]MTI37903.1 peptidase [Fulvivirga lutimaris]
MAYSFLLLLLFLGVTVYLLNRRPKRSSYQNKLLPTPKKWKAILNQRVHFYKNLSEEKKLQFEADIQRFLQHIKITGVHTEVTLEDRLLVASSAVIPLFGFPAWSYKNLDEVLLYPSAFDRNFNFDNNAEYITGMVGSGAMEGKVIFSKPSLHLGFDITNDKKNVGIHEFAHLFDKEDGVIDGIPPSLNDKPYSIPWIDLARKQTSKILANSSDINPYGATNMQEFFAVASEYFFERPHLLKEKHSELYDALSGIFNQDLTAVIDKSSFKKESEIGRNDLCPCGSGLKYKRCCLN